MPDLFARPLGRDGEPTGPMQRLGTMKTMRVSGKLTLHGQGPVAERLNAIITASNPFLDDLGWDGRPIRTDGEWTAPIELTFPQAHLSLGFWVLFFTNASDAPPPVSRGSAWRDGAYAACQHQLTGPPKQPPVPRIIRPVYPRWYIDLLLLHIRRAYAEHPELFNPPAWLTRDARTVARDYPPPAERPFPRFTREQVWAAANLRTVNGVVLPKWAAKAIAEQRTDFMPRYPK